jgi:hypothetical protein
MIAQKAREQRRVAAIWFPLLKVGVQGVKFV